MGIVGLHALIKPSLKSSPISAYSGSRIGVDGHAWLHQILPSIAEEIFSGKEVHHHTHLFLRKVESLKAHRIHPVIVFDGDPLDGKRVTNLKRSEERKKYAAEARACLERKEYEKAREYMKRSVGVTKPVLLSVIEALRATGTEYIISPYEADAQLSFLQKIGYIDYIISEDSDLVPYYASRTLYKYNMTTVEEYDSGALRCKNSFFVQNILDICILAGCDYLPSIRGIGINLAHKFLEKHQSVRELVQALEAAGKDIPPDYLEKFVVAKLTFLHHIIYNPLTGKRENLNVTEKEYKFLGTLNDIPFYLEDFSRNVHCCERHFRPRDVRREYSACSAGCATKQLSSPIASEADL